MRKFLLFIFFFILIFLHVYSYDQIHPIFIDAPLIDGINITCENILTTNDSLTDLYLWDLNTRDIISDNYPIQLNGALISLPLIQKIGDGGLNYITYCIQDNSGIIYFNVVDYLGNQHPLFPKRLMAKPTSTPIVREIDNETQMIFGTDSGEIIILDISEDMDENNYISIQTPGTNSVVNLIDLNNDNDDEIIVSVKTYATQYKIKYYEYNIDTWEENTNQITFNGLITSNLIFKDLDSDGNPEIIFGSDNGNINIYSGFGGYSAYGTYPQNVSSLEIINLQDFTGDSIIAFDNEKSGFKVNMNIFSTEILISGQDSNLYSTLPLISPYKTFDYAIFTSFNGSDLRLKYSTGRIEEWGYFNHFIKRSVNNTVIQIQTTSPINVSNIISDTVPLEIVVGTNNYDDPNLGEIYWCGYLIDDRKNTIEPIPVESSYKYNNNRFIGYYNYVGIYGDILQIPKSMLTPGTYKVLVAAIDGKGGYNIEIKEFEFTYEDTFFIEITRPFADQILDGELQLIQEVHGTARYMTGFTNFVFYYMLTYSTIENPGTRTTIAGGTEQFTDIKIADWNISALASGKYMLYLTANIRNLTLNETDEFSQPIIIDNEHPTAIILNLFEEKVITGRYNILGVADDPNFTGYNLKIKPYDSNIWIPLTETIYESKQNEVLHCLNTSNFDDGLYNVKLTVSDIAGKTTDFTVRDIHILNSLDNIVLESSLDTFSPNEDICNDYTVFTFSEDNISVPLIGDIFIRDENGLTVRTINVPDTNSSYVWDGKDDLGVYLPEGLYICSAVFNDTGTGTYYSNEKFISIAFNDEIVEFYAEDTLNYEYWVYLMQPDKHPVENKMLYIRGGSHCGCGLGCQSYPCRLPYCLVRNCSIWEMDLDTGATTELVSKQTGLEPPPWEFNRRFTISPKYSPDGSIFMFIREYVLKIYDNGVVTNYQKPGGGTPKVRDYWWHPTDPNQFVYIDCYESDDKIIWVNGNTETEIYSGYLFEMAWSPNGNYIVWAAWESFASINYQYIYTYNLNSGKLNILDQDSEHNVGFYLLRSSPDSGKLAYIHYSSGDFVELKVLYLNESGDLDINYLENPRVIAPIIYNPQFLNVRLYAPIGWTIDSKWLIYGDITESGKEGCYDTGIIKSDGLSSRTMTRGTPPYWVTKIKACTDEGFNHHTIAEDINLLPFLQWNIAVAAGFPIFDPIEEKFTYVGYSDRNGEIKEYYYQIIPNCWVLEWNVPGNVISYDNQVNVEIGPTALNLPQDILMITPVLIPMDSPAYDMTEIYPVISEPYEIALQSNQTYFNEYITMEFTYTDTQTFGMEECLINVFTFDESLAKWVIAQPNPAFVSQDLENNKIRIKTNHLSLYILSGKVLDETIPNITSLGIDNKIFSPNSDTIKDRVVFNLKTDKEATVHFIIRDELENKILEKATKIDGNTGINFIWDGKNYNGIIQQDGKYSVEFYAENSEGQRSSNVITNVYLDNTQPLISVNNVENNGMYNRDKIPIIQVSDKFPDTLDVRLNGNEYSTGTTISEEGNHELEITATDLAGNSSSLNLRFLIDKSLPSSEISYEPYSIQNGLISIIPQTDFTITSVDSGNPPSGLKKSEYKISDNSNYDSGWLNYLEPFSLDNHDEGRWIIKYRGIDNAGNIEEDNELKVILKDTLDEDESVLTFGSTLLVWINEEALNSDSQEIRKLKEVLDEFVPYYKIVYSKQDFVNDFRTNLYRVYLVLGNSRNLDKLHSDEIREHIRLGKGIISSEYKHFQGEGNESEVFGIQFKGYYPDKEYEIILNNSPVSTQAVFPVRVKLEKLELLTGTPIGDFENSGKYSPVIILNKFGEGETVYIGFNLLKGINEENISTIKKLLRKSFRYLKKPIFYTFPSAKLPFQLDLKSSSVKVEMKILENVPGTMTILETLPEADILNENSAEWYFTLNPGVRKRIISLNKSPDTPGYYEIHFDAYTKEGGIYEISRNFLFVLEIKFHKSNYINELILDLNQLGLEGDEQKWLEKTIDILGKVNIAVPSDINSTEKIIRDLFKALEFLNKIESIDVTVYHKQISILILYNEIVIDNFNSQNKIQGGK